MTVAVAYLAGMVLYCVFMGSGHGKTGASVDAYKTTLICILWPIWLAWDAGYWIGRKLR